MMNNELLKNYVECAFDYDSLEEAICEALDHYIDYDDVAHSILGECASIIQRFAQEFAAAHLGL